MTRTRRRTHHEKVVYPDRPPPHRKTSFGPVVPVDPARSSAWFAFVYAVLVGSVKALAAVFSGALLAVFK